MLDPAVLALLRCPQTQQTLTLASSEQLAQARAQADETLEAALVRADGAILYPIRNGIPVLLTEAAVAVTSASPPH
jgi:uncharacterized protein YbaR (Trm112 family)